MASRSRCPLCARIIFRTRLALTAHTLIGKLLADAATALLATPLVVIDRGQRPGVEIVAAFLVASPR